MRRRCCASWFDDRPAGIAKRQKFRHFVECFAGGVIACAAHVLVRPAAGRGIVRLDKGACVRRRRPAPAEGTEVLYCPRAFSSISTAWMCPSRWLTAMIGLSAVKASAFA